MFDHRKMRQRPYFKIVSKEIDSGPWWYNLLAICSKLCAITLKCERWQYMGETSKYSLPSANERSKRPQFIHCAQHQYTATYYHMANSWLLKPKSPHWTKVTCQGVWNILIREIMQVMEKMLYNLINSCYFTWHYSQLNQQWHTWIILCTRINAVVDHKLVINMPW